MKVPLSRVGKLVRIEIPMFTIIDHTADLGVEIIGKDLGELFLSAVEGVLSLIQKESFTSSKELEEFVINSDGWDDEERLVNLINDVLYYVQVYGWWVRDVLDVHISESGSVEMRMCGTQTLDKNHLKREIKAATFHDLKIIRNVVLKTTLILDV